MKNSLLLSQSVIFVLLLPFFACGQDHPDVSVSPVFQEMNTKKAAAGETSKTDTATLAAGCFWCVEAQFKELKGVKKVISGFIGGTVANPSYELVCTGTTGHAEACNIIYDPSKISYDEILAAFFTAHDPTQLNRQGNDVGTQYRSAIFYHNPKQQQLAEYYVTRLNEEKAYASKVVTEVQPYGTFYKAENYHQDYYSQNKNQPYCLFVIGPEVANFRKVFKDKVRK
jgi:peptide-methionine (S)-S-oxide reductase